MYKGELEKFFGRMNITPEQLLEDWNKVRYDLRLRDEFLEEWTERIENYANGKNTDYAPKTRARMLATVVSFFRKVKIPVEVEWKKVFVVNHNRDLRKDEVRRILENSELRERCFFLMLAESGQRPDTIVSLRYKHIKKEFEEGKVPMLVQLPSELLKGRVESRFTFLGEDGVNTLKEYLSTRKLGDEDFLFERKRTVSDEYKEGHVQGSAFSIAFERIARKLGLVTEEKTKKTGPQHQIRLYCLRKYFNNNIRADRSYIEYWMAHTDTVQGAYVSKDVEEHRRRYAEGYESLRVFAPDKNIADLNKRLMDKDRELTELRAEFVKLAERIKTLEAYASIIKIAEEETT